MKTRSRIKVTSMNFENFIYLFISINAVPTLFKQLFFHREKAEKDATKNFSRERSTLSERVATPIDGLPLPPPPSTPFRVESRFSLANFFLILLTIDDKIIYYIYIGNKSTKQFEKTWIQRDHSTRKEFLFL